MSHYQTVIRAIARRRRGGKPNPITIAQTWVHHTISTLLYVTAGFFLGLSGTLWWCSEWLMGQIELAPYFSILARSSSYGSQIFIKAAVGSSVFLIVERAYSYLTLRKVYQQAAADNLALKEKISAHTGLTPQ